LTCWWGGKRRHGATTRRDWELGVEAEEGSQAVCGVEGIQDGGKIRWGALIGEDEIFQSKRLCLFVNVMIGVENIF